MSQPTFEEVQPRLKRVCRKSVSSAQKTSIHQTSSCRRRASTRRKPVQNQPYLWESIGNFQWKLNPNDDITYWPTHHIVAGHKAKLVLERSSSSSSDIQPVYLTWCQRPAVTLPYEESVLHTDSWRLFDLAEQHPGTIYHYQRPETDISASDDQDIWKCVQIIVVDGVKYIKIEYFPTPVPYNCLSPELKEILYKLTLEKGANFVDATAFLNPTMLDMFEQNLTLVDRYTNVYQLFINNYNEKLFEMPEYIVNNEVGQDKERVSFLDAYFRQIVNNVTIPKLVFDYNEQLLLTTRVVLGYSDSHKTEDFDGFSLIQPVARHDTVEALVLVDDNEPINNVEFDDDRSTIILESGILENSVLDLTKDTAGSVNNVPIPDQVSRNVECGKCGNLFYNLRDMRKHSRKYHIMIRCDICTKLITEGDFKNHSVLHIGENQCPVCFKCFETRRKLQVHVPTHRRFNKRSRED